MSMILPRNLTARAAAQVVGNPVSTRLEAGVANCFPGLEWDVRELDRRFFPGLVFQFVTTPLLPVAGTLPDQQGARIAYVDSINDPALSADSTEPWVQTLLEVLQQNIGEPNPLSLGRWYLEWFEQHGKRFSMRDEQNQPYDGELVWRLVRGIEPDLPLTICVLQRDDNGLGVAPAVELSGFRRRYVDAAGVIDASFRPGELTMSMCNPWSHDFRDCGCHYWASNHPDVVFGPSDALIEDGQSTHANEASIRLDWIRADRSVAGRVAAGLTDLDNRPFEMDHYEMNSRWTELPFVLEGREIGDFYAGPMFELEMSHGTLDSLVAPLSKELAPLELTLALQYLSAFFSVRAPDEVDVLQWPNLPGEVQAIRQYLMIVAVGEMMHLRWANKMLWELDRLGHYPAGQHYVPVLTPAAMISNLKVPQPRKLAPLSMQLIAEFVEIERPFGTVDTAYCRIVATLKNDVSSDRLLELAIRIDTDGNEHFQRFQEVQRIIEMYPDGDDAPYRRSFRIGSHEECAEALDAYHALLTSLSSAYQDEADGHGHEGQESIDGARVAMTLLREKADALARKGIAIPFWDDTPIDAPAVSPVPNTPPSTAATVPIVAQVVAPVVAKGLPS